MNQEHAKTLYFQSDMTVTQISEILSIPRPTLHFWIMDKHWERMKKSAQHMPSLIREDMHHLIARYTRQLNGEDRLMKPVTRHEAETLHKLTLTASKVGDCYSISQSMEVFGRFMEEVYAQSPEMASAITPFVDSFIQNQAAKTVAHFRPDHYTNQGLVPVEKENAEEIRKDMDDIMAWTAGPSILSYDPSLDPDQPTPATTEAIVEKPTPAAPIATPTQPAVAAQATEVAAATAPRKCSHAGLRKLLAKDLTPKNKKVPTIIKNNRPNASAA